MLLANSAIFNQQKNLVYIKCQLKRLLNNNFLWDLNGQCGLPMRNSWRVAGKVEGMMLRKLPRKQRVPQTTCDQNYIVVYIFQEIFSAMRISLPYILKKRKTFTAASFNWYSYCEELCLYFHNLQAWNWNISARVSCRKIKYERYRKSCCCGSDLLL